MLRSIVSAALCALLKRYFGEAGSKAVIAKWKQAMEIVTSSVAYAETMATLHRKIREENLGEEFLIKVLSMFQRDWQGLIRVEAGDHLNELIDRLVKIKPVQKR